MKQSRFTNGDRSMAEWSPRHAAHGIVRVAAY